MSPLQARFCWRLAHVRPLTHKETGVQAKGLLKVFKAQWLKGSFINAYSTCEPSGVHAMCLGGVGGWASSLSAVSSGRGEAQVCSCSVCLRPWHESTIHRHVLAGGIIRTVERKQIQRMQQKGNSTGRGTHVFMHYLMWWLVWVNHMCSPNQGWHIHVCLFVCFLT